VIALPIARRRPTGRRRLEAHGTGLPAVCRYWQSVRRQTRAKRQSL